MPRARSRIDVSSYKSDMETDNSGEEQMTTRPRAVQKPGLIKGSDLQKDNRTDHRKANRTTGKVLYDHLEFSIPRLKLALVSEKHTLRPWPKIASAQDAAKLLKPLRYATEEHFVSLHLNAKFEVIGLHEVSHGTLSASLVHPREVFKAALVANSYAILVCHNHPSGASLSPSREDFDTTSQLIDAGKCLGVTLIDHLIIGLENKRLEFNGGEERELIYSFREIHPELWSTKG